MASTPEPATVKTAILNRLTAYCGPWTPVALADLFIAMAMDLGLIPADLQHLAPITEAHVPLLVMTVAQTLRRNEGRAAHHIEMAQTVLDTLRAFHRDYATTVAEAIGLTSRQREALISVAHGHTYAQIGDDLGLEPTTVSTHLENARKALDARNSLEAVIKALKMGLIGIDEIDVPLPALAAA